MVWPNYWLIWASKTSWDARGHYGRHDIPIKAAAYNNGTGKYDDVPAANIEIRNIRRYDWGAADQAARPCLGGPGGVNQAPNNYTGYAGQNVVALNTALTPTTSVGVSWGSREDAGQRLLYRFDYEDCKGWEWDVVATAPDGSGHTSTCKMRAIVRDRNDKPFWDADNGEAVIRGDIFGKPKVTGILPRLANNRSVLERSERNTAVGNPLLAGDPDKLEGQDIFFSLVPGHNGDGFFRINKCSGQIFVAQEGLDYGKQQTYILQVEVSDDPDYFKWESRKASGTRRNARQSYKAIRPTEVVINIEDVNDVPIICTDAFAFPECQAAVPHSPTGCDPVQTDSTELDYCLRVELNEFQIYEDDVASTGTGTIPPFATDASTTPTTKYVVDLDGDDLQYTIDKGELDGAMFDINVNSGKITVAAGQKLDYESRQYYTVRVTVKDFHAGVARGGTISYDFPVAVLDANDAPVLDFFSFPSLFLYPFISFYSSLFSRKNSILFFYL